MSNLHPQTQAALGNLLYKLSGNAKTRERQLALIKEVEPGYRLPGDVQIAQVEQKLRAEREAEKKAEKEERTKNNRARARKELVETHGEDVVKAIEEGPLKKYPHLDWEDAAKLYAAEEGPIVSNGQAERGRQGQIWEFPDIPNLLKDPTKAASDMAYSMIDGFRAGRRP